MKIRKRNEEKKTITSVSSIQRNSSMVHEQKSVDSKRNKNVKKTEEEEKGLLVSALHKGTHSWSMNKNG